MASSGQELGQTLGIRLSATADALALSAKRPLQSFTLANGLTTIIVHQPKAPLVQMALYYRVGSRDEPQFRTGFAHLFEHLMFEGSENVPDFDKPLVAAGAEINGWTSFDFTGYVIDAPLGALDLALFQESDRMGHLLGALSQESLDLQRDVVKNEKRENDNQPYGLSRYAELEELFPQGHPYHHAPIGAMDDLDAATLGDVHGWFRRHYGPRNAALVLVGDVDLQTARAKVQEWFGEIPPGPASWGQVGADPVTLPVERNREIRDTVPLLRLQRLWSGPPLLSPDSAALLVAMEALGGMNSSRLDRTLVRGQAVANTVWAYIEFHQLASIINIGMDVRQNLSREHAEAAFDAELSRFLSEGPSIAEVQRASTRLIASRLFSLDKWLHTMIAEGWVQAGDPSYMIEKDLRHIAAVTPESAKTALERWLLRPRVMLNIIPGNRPHSNQLSGSKGSSIRSGLMEIRAEEQADVMSSPRDQKPPAVVQVGALDFLQVQRSTLSNGIPVALVPRGKSPTVEVSLSFKGGFSTDAVQMRGTMNLLVRSLREGSASIDTEAQYDELDRLGASLSTSVTPDYARLGLSALTPNLGPSLELLADAVRQPAFRADIIERLQHEQQTKVIKAMHDPTDLAYRQLRQLLYGAAHPYGADALGTKETISTITPEDLQKAHKRWFRPDMLRVTVVGDVTMEQLKPLLERAFGTWQAEPGPVPFVQVVDVPAQPSRVLLVDRPGAGQSVIAAGRVLQLRGTSGPGESVGLANAVLGGSFLSRLNTKLREQKGWSYGVASYLTYNSGPRGFTITAPVQTDRTVDAIRTVQSEMRSFSSNKGVRPEELQRVTEGELHRMATLYRSNRDILDAVEFNDDLIRPPDYLIRRPKILRAISADEINDAARTYFQPDGLVFVVVGDRGKVEPQLRELGLPIEFIPDPAAHKPR
nr:pitrilysin family protein [Cyanobium gracile]